MTYVIVSECERGFWSNQYGWVCDKDSASVFSSVEEYPLPLRARHEGSFVDIRLAPEFFLEEPLHSGDEVVWHNPVDGTQTTPMRVDCVKTADGCARTSEDIVVLRDAAGAIVEAVACAVAFASPTSMVFEA